MIASRNIPRIVVAATGSGVGKTTATVALLGALRARGLKVAAFKCGPDYPIPPITNAPPAFARTTSTAG